MELEVHKLVKQYPKKRALNGVSFTLNEVRLRSSGA